MANVISENLVSLVNDQIGSHLLDQIRSVLGNEGPKASAAIESFVPAMLSGMTNLAGSSHGADVIFDTLASQDDGMLNNVQAMMREGQLSAVVDQGRNLLRTLFGTSGVDKLGYVLSAFTGVSLGNSASLIGILAPLVIGVIKREFMGEMPNANDLASVVQRQTPHVNAAMPSGLLEQLQSSGFLSSISGTETERVATATSNARGTVSNVQHSALKEAESHSSWLRYLLPIAVLAVLGWLAVSFF